MKSLILAILLGSCANSVIAEVSTKDFDSFLDDTNFTAEDSQFTALGAADIEYGSDELWLQGLMIFNLISPEFISITFKIEPPEEITHGIDFASSYVSSNFPCGHFGNWANLGFFPISSSDSNIQDCGLPGNSSSGGKSIDIDLQPIPEPKTYAMILFGLMLIGLAARQETFYRI